MEWVYLGHAMWLVRVAGLRLLFDPLLAGPHYGGVFEVSPRRSIEAALLRADFIFVSHRHPDHFNLASLAALAELDADSVVVSPDPLVLEAARRLGFRQRRQLGPWQRVALDGVTLLTTPSDAEDIEWGMLVADGEGVAWNQVDSVQRDAQAVNHILECAVQELAPSAPKQRLALALAQWQPMLEVQAQLAEASCFPLSAYAAGLAKIAALDAHTVVPAAAGTRHRGGADWLNEFVYPVNVQRVVRDIEARCRDSRAAVAQVGHCYAVRGGATELWGEDAEGVVSAVGPAAPERYRPFAGPPVTDPNLEQRVTDDLRRSLEIWIDGDLCRALAQAYPNFGAARPLLLALQVVYPCGAETYLFTVSSQGCSVSKGWSDDYDMLNVIAASMLADVLAGRRHWGEPLLGGWLRANHRAYRVDGQGVTRLNIGRIFLYYALSYRDSNERWVRYQLKQLRR